MFSTMMSGNADGLRAPPPASGMGAGLTAGAGGGALDGASTGVSIRVKSLGPVARGDGADDGVGGGA